VRLVHCAYDKNHKVRELTLNFVEDGKLWTLPIHICVDADCLRLRGASEKYHRAEKGAKQT
jgi:hypothetical protein